MKIEGCAKLFVAVIPPGLEELFPEVIGCSTAVSSGLVESQCLSSSTIRSVDAILRRDRGHILTNDLADADTSKLDRRGIAMIGSRVSRSDVLIGKGRSVENTKLTTEEQLLNKIFDRRPEGFRLADEGVRYPFSETGCVVNTQLITKRLFHCENCGEIPDLQIEPLYQGLSLIHI